jgi:cytochrome c oxidase cbb3-type subunit 3
MSSVSDHAVRGIAGVSLMRSIRHLALVAAIVATTTGCRGSDPAPAVAAAAALPAQFAVGPVPGPHEPARAIPNPFADDPAALQQGRELFVVMNCSGCHGGHAGGGMGPSLRDVDWIYGSADANIFSSIAEGRANGMPAWGSRLPEQTIWALVAYIRSLRTPREPDAPG